MSRATFFNMRFNTGSFAARLLAICASMISVCRGISINQQDSASVRNAAATTAFGMMKYYSNNASDTPVDLKGLLPYPPYYWWESGAMWGAMVDYHAYTGDISYLTATINGLISQVGPNNDYIVPAHNFDEGNDDQAFWGFALLSAIESNLPNAPAPAHDWLTLTRALFANQVSRWDTSTCNGGMRWQIYPDNSNPGGYFYKNAISNGGTFALAARLARITSGAESERYLQWANAIWDWSVKVGLIDSAYNVFDGTDASTACSSVRGPQWSYNVGVYLYGASAMAALTNDDMWKERADGLFRSAEVFFRPGVDGGSVIYEAACEPYGTCNTDQLAFKGFLARWMVKGADLLPDHRERVSELLRSSAGAAAQSCSGGTDGVTCGIKYYQSGWDGTWGVGQQMSAMETIQSLLVVNGWS
ncbi:mannan endo-1,6-alpha-mannosidase DCW1-like protein [Microthyrium microscopicum]|uniref:Mannan endo-1,6-alpha-mannosidase n=1 Tax=Microthyrium microscopicum TaxID=703497 RepID=A0A6A6U6C9_9PEZI|nr:mannan endo-1,6-alpha-mannosidase DCW1-like protein [Microthyrium microscopicum]